MKENKMKENNKKKLVNERIIRALLYAGALMYIYLFAIVLGAFDSATYYEVIPCGDYLTETPILYDCERARNPYLETSRSAVTWATALWVAAAVLAYRNELVRKANRRQQL